MKNKFKTHEDIASDRKRRSQVIKYRCNNNLILAAPWPKYGENLGTLLRTCDALGGCLAVTNNPVTSYAVKKGLTVGEDVCCIHWLQDSVESWLEKMHRDRWTIIGVELAHDSIPIKDLEPVYRKALIVLGNEASGIPKKFHQYMDIVTEIPQYGFGHSLNVAVAGSLVAYKVTGNI